MRFSITVVFCLVNFFPEATAFSAAPLWTLRYTSSYTPAVVDAAGNSYFAGIDLVKVTPQGQIEWATRLPASTYAFLYGVTTDPTGNVYVTGDALNEFGSPTNYQDIALLKFDATGRLLWQVTYDPLDHTLDFSNGAGLDAEGNIYVAGRSYSFAITAAYHTILKYDGEGHLLWARRFEPSTNSLPHNNGTLAVNPLGGMAVAASSSIASYSSSGDLLWSWIATNVVDPRLIDFDSSGNLMGLSASLALTKFSPSGQALWTAAHQAPPLDHGSALDLKLDARGNAYLLENAAIRCRLEDEDEEEYECRTLPLLIKFNSNGQEHWASRFGFRTNLYAEPGGLALDEVGGAYVTARIYYGDESLPPFGFIAKCDRSGNQVWRTSYKTDSNRELFLTTPQIDPGRDIIVSGELIDRTGAGEVDFLLLKYGEPPPPGFRIRVPPRAQTVAAGETATFSVLATSQGRLTYQWRSNGEPLAGQTRRTLTLSNVQVAQAGEYSVKVSNGHSTIVTPEARLAVTP